MYIILLITIRCIFLGTNKFDLILGKLNKYITFQIYVSRCIRATYCVCEPRQRLMLLDMLFLSRESLGLSADYSKSAWNIARLENVDERLLENQESMEGEIE